MAELRASTLKYNISAARSSAAGNRALERVDLQVLDEINQAARTAWLPAEYVRLVNAALLEEGGDALVVDLNRKLTKQTVYMPLFRPIISGALRVFQGDPGAVLKAIPHSLRLTTRGWGECRMDVWKDRQTATMTYSGVAPELRHRAWLLAMTGGLLGSVDLARVRGEVTSESSALEQGVVQFDIQWFS